MSTIPATPEVSDTEETPLPLLEASLLALASDLAAAECRWLQMLAEFDRREGWAGVGVVSCAHWLSWRCGLSLSTAREKVRVARALLTLPKISASFEKGELSYSRARAIVRAADPENEALLLDIARHSTGAQLERIVRATVGVQRLEEVRERRSRRTVHWHWDEDGSLVLRARLEPEEGAAVLAALEAAQARQLSSEPSEEATDAVAENEEVDETDDDGREREEGEPDRAGDGRPAPALMTADERAATRADGLVAIAEAFIAHQAPVDGADVFQVVVHLKDDAPPHLEDGPVLAVETAMRLSCDSSIYCIHEDVRGAVLDVGRASRRIPRALRRALWRRDGGCRFPGCGRRRRVDAHHVVHWSKLGPTCLDNLVLLCRHHHTLVHEGGFGLRMNAQGHPEFRTPDGAELPEFPGAARSENQPRHWHRGEVAADAVDTQWGGEPADVGYVASVICQSAHVAELAPG
ncbi:MAG: hypothetical protein QOE76_51 [Frankiales bacterium]|jgi:hypothetical protein|nr:hypothetical protein [Frankiales bacterium]